MEKKVDPGSFQWYLVKGQEGEWTQTEIQKIPGKHEKKPLYYENGQTLTCPEQLPRNVEDFPLLDKCQTQLDIVLGSLL